MTWRAPDPPPSERSPLPSRAHAELGAGFYDVVAPASFPRRTLRFRNQRWAERMGLGSLDPATFERHFARFEPIAGSFAEPLALRYHGHQFGVYNPQLGDGRGFLFAQLVDPVSGWLLDLGTKGSGTTPWSRGGDGRLTLKGGLREIIATEMLEALGVPTSRTFSLFETGEPLYRGDEPSPTRSSVLVRLGRSHLRFGTFQRFAHERDAVRMTRLVEHVTLHHYPEIAGDPDLPRALLGAVASRSADLAAAYDVAGFVHGVLNTDNMNITGESFDYGPYRFLLRRDPEHVAAYFDASGLYAFGRQAETFRWNLGRLADALRIIAPSSALHGALDGFVPRFDAQRASRFVARLGLASEGHDEDLLLAHSAFAFLERSQLTMDAFFFDWHAGEASAARALRGPRAKLYGDKEFAAFRRLLELYRPSCDASLRTPYFERDDPVTAAYDRIEQVWRAIDLVDDWQPFEQLIADIRELGAQCSSRGLTGRSETPETQSRS